MQIIVYSESTQLLELDSNTATVNSIKSELSLIECISEDDFEVEYDGTLLRNDEILESSDLIILRVHYSNSLIGGKGGFGAQLRSLAKQKPKKRTTDFGACRDLSGRRLRHVNNEILLQKWKESRDKNEKFDVEEETATGIELWYLSTPTWADGGKSSYRKRFMKPRFKTTICLDWMRARENRDPPEGTPLHWGCPRGPRCEFAHGEQELQGKYAVELKDSRESARREKETKKKSQYMDVLSNAARDDQQYNELIMAGLRAAKRAKSNTEQSIIPNKPLTKESNKTEDNSKKIDETLESDSELEAEVKEETVEPKEENIEGIDGNDLMETISGDVIITQSMDALVLAGNSKFGTVVAKDCFISAMTELGESGNIHWYYEVELLSNGLMQVGWGTEGFLRSDKGKKSVEGEEEEETDGVGDDKFSWAFDGYRQLKWTNGESSEYGPQTGKIWAVGDVIGCSLQIIKEKNELQSTSEPKRGKQAKGRGKRKSNVLESNEGVNSIEVKFAMISFTVNGESYGEAFKVPVLSDTAVWFPALSIEGDESVIVNLGTSPFRFNPCAPTDGSTSTSDINSTFEPVLKAMSVTTENLTDLTVNGEKSNNTKKVNDHDQKSQETKPMDYKPVELEGEAYDSVDAVMKLLDPAYMKWELQRRGLKAGGTAEERATRLFAVRGVPEDKIDPKLKAKKNNL